MGAAASSARCDICTEKISIPVRREVGAKLRVWASYAQLVLLATSGCDICTLVRQYLTTYVSESQMSRVGGEIHLYGDSEGLALECPAFQGGFNIPLKSPGAEGLRPAPSWDPSDMLPKASIWLRSCITHHTSCRDLNPNHDPLARLPRRLLDLSHETNVVIADVAEWMSLGIATDEELSDYCALSYQWGEGSHNCTLSTSFSTLLEVSFDTLPQTFKDAVIVARSLGVRFLWIDALCIIQPSASGDYADWRAEGPRMGVIYENAVFTIAATCAESTDEGFLAKTGSNVYGAQPCKVRVRRQGEVYNAHTRTLELDGVEVETDAYLPVSAPSFFQSVSSSGLNKRGWVMQERALSRRLLHFTENGLFWECCVSKAHDQFGEFDPGKHVGPCRTKETLLSVARSRHSRHLCPVEWFHFISAYSHAGFTDARDRLIALSSVAQAAQPILGGHPYYAGLWGNDLIRGLMWCTYKPSARLRDEDGHIAPTWSWASVGGQISFVTLGIDTFDTPLVDVVRVTTIPVQGGNPFGSLREGRLVLSGGLSEEILPTTNTFEWRPRMVVQWDEQQDTTSASRSFTVLPIGGCTKFSASELLFGALILERVNLSDADNSAPVAERVYRRIGWVEYDAGFRTQSGDTLKESWVGRFAQEITIV
jgi:hypothetical protein